MVVSAFTARMSALKEKRATYSPIKLIAIIDRGTVALVAMNTNKAYVVVVAYLAC